MLELIGLIALFIFFPTFMLTIVGVLLGAALFAYIFDKVGGNLR